MRVSDDPLVAAILAAWPGAKIHMSDPTEIEIEGMYAGADAGGAYLDSIGKSDLAEFTEDEWMSFIEKVIVGFQDKVSELAKPFEKDPPF